MPALRLTRKSGDLSGRKTGVIFKRTREKHGLFLVMRAGIPFPRPLQYYKGGTFRYPLCNRCSLFEAGGSGAAPPKTYGLAHTSEAGFAVQWTGRRRGQDVILFPVVGTDMTRQKSGLSRGTWNKCASACFMPRKPLDRSDRRSGPLERPVSDL